MNEMENDNKDRSDRIDEIAENALELSPGDRVNTWIGNAATIWNCVLESRRC